MASLDITVASSVLALLRRDVTASFLADRYGVTEAQVLEWQDVFLVAGVLALAEFQSGGKVFAHLGEGSRPQQRGGQGNGGLGEPTTPGPDGGMATITPRSSRGGPVEATTFPPDWAAGPEVPTTRPPRMRRRPLGR